MDNLIIPRSIARSVDDAARVGAAHAVGDLADEHAAKNTITMRVRGSHGRNRMANLAKQRDRAVSRAPTLDVVPVEVGTSHGDDVADVVAVFRSIGSHGPQQLGDDHVLGRGHEDLAAQDADALGYALAATLGKASHDLKAAVIGDGLVPVASALGEHRDPRWSLALPPSHRRIVYEAGHLDLLSRQDVYEQVRDWLA
jgi:hypothetical protein